MSHTTIKHLRAPVSDPSILTNREQIILLQSSKLHGCVFPPWKGEPTAQEFEGDAFEDPIDLRLSDAQKRVFDGWRRLSAAQVRAYGSLNPHLDLVQDITNDCSVVASLCALSARAERLAGDGATPVGSSFPAVFPYGEAAPSANGKYVLRLHFNGCDRKVVVDDRLPRSKSAARSLHIFDRKDPEVLWPGLIEKAYLKVRGGYDFLGSTSGTDLLVLAGWIPEQVFLQDDDTECEAEWRRIFKAFGYGDVLITIGTGKLTSSEQEAFGLASEHAYAVLDMSEADGRQRLLIKNPWVDGKAWTKLPENGDKSKDAHAKDIPSAAGAGESGTFLMELHELVQFFETMHLSWNPGLFAHRRDCHFSWDLQDKSCPPSLARNPQYLVRSSKGGSVWLLLNRHFRSRKNIEGQSNGTCDNVFFIEYMGLCLFDSSYRVASNAGHLQRTSFIESDSVLLRFETKPGKSYVAAIIQEDIKPSPISFTLSAFSLLPIDAFQPAIEEYQYSIEAPGSWTPSTAGGNVTNLSYHTNPSYSLTVPKATPLLIALESPNDSLALHAKLLWLRGQRVSGPLTTRDVIGDSGEYRRGCAIARLQEAIPAGTYTLVVSTYNEGQCDKYMVRVRATVPGCILKPISPEDAGRIVTQLATPPFAAGTDRVLAPLEVTRLTTLRVRAMSDRRGAADRALECGSEIRLSIEHDQGPNTHVLATSKMGAFGDARRGIATPDVHLSPAMCNLQGPGVWLVVERAGGNGHGAAGEGDETKVEVLATERGVTAGPWGRESDEKIEELERRMSAATVGSGKR